MRQFISYAYFNNDSGIFGLGNSEFEGLVPNSDTIRLLTLDTKKGLAKIGITDVSVVILNWRKFDE